MAGSRPVTPASPKLDRPKDPEPGVPLYGCGEARTESIALENITEIKQNTSSAS